MGVVKGDKRLTTLTTEMYCVQTAKDIPPVKFAVFFKTTLFVCNVDVSE
jgi:hypothetical protein